MATIERRQLKRGTSFRVEWRHNGERHRLTYDNEHDALEWKHLIEIAGGNPDKADRALLDKSSSAPLLSEPNPSTAACPKCDPTSAPATSKASKSAAATNGASKTRSLAK